MSFSYDTSMEPWRPAGDPGNMRIRVLELYPLPWYLRWIPQSWESYIALRATLAWAPLPEITVNKRTVIDAGIDNAASENDTANSLVNTGTSTSSSTTPDFKRTDESRSTTSSRKRSPAYKALSYTWGTNRSTSDVLINGKNLTITLSLATALYHLRHRSKPLRIWIDQISINQQDLHEKTEQVQHMDRVYRNTEETLVWLGPAQSGSDALMDVFNKMGAFAERFDLYSYYTKAKYHELFAIETKENPEDPRTIEYHACCDGVMDDITYAFYESLVDFYHLPYFQRAWVRSPEYCLLMVLRLILRVHQSASRNLVCLRE
ncbi:heterokaryon incompatibility protein-domain-containing protein [Phaeosphaeria sp. MPI-PUGE-AT-0046c]|nr:heterokaryon incompatibility protein-domain-containing protein [Phaeosphaeria sp. MPI-PUGE-AT-0046c]